MADRAGEPSRGASPNQDSSIIAPRFLASRLELSPRLAILAALVATAMLSVVDRATGVEVSFSVFYLLPVFPLALALISLVQIRSTTTSSLASSGTTLPMLPYRISIFPSKLPLC